MITLPLSLPGFVARTVPLFETDPISTTNQTALAIVWDLVDLIIICASRTHHGIHPAGAIGVDFAIWAACAGTAGWVGTVLSPIQALCNDPGCNDPYDWMLVNLYVIIAFLCALL